MHSLRRRSLRASLILAMVAAAVLAAALLVTPGSANAAGVAHVTATCTPSAALPNSRPAFHSDCPRYAGWARISSEPVDSCVWQGCKRMSLNLPVPAWTWYRGWHAGELANGTTVYVWPFATGWSWAWTNGRWHAVSSASVRVG